tara:strand:- start:1 stop:249 length:249 start_codon:yes stop_codon:yes gene_type:complete
MSSIKDIEALIGTLSAEQIRAIMSEVKAKKPTKVDTTRKARRIALTQLYFDNAPRPKDNFEDYLNHSDGVREAILMGEVAWK